MKWLLAAAFVLLASQPVAAATIVKTTSAAKPGFYQAEIKYPQFTNTTPLVRFANQRLANWASDESSDELGADFRRSLVLGP